MVGRRAGALAAVNARIGERSNIEGVLISQIGQQVLLILTTILEGLRHMARNGPFVRLIAAYFINGLSNGIPATLFLYFVSERLGAPRFARMK